MTHDWDADITNDPRDDYELCVELSERGTHRATIRRDADGVLVLRVCPDSAAFSIPAAWLLGVVERAEAELPIRGDSRGG